MNKCRHKWAFGDKLAECLNCGEPVEPGYKPSHNDISQDVARVASQAVTVLLDKHDDYGPKNIAMSPGGPLNGLRVRMHDKMARINHLIDTGADAKNEPLRDSFLDLANYAIIAMLVLDGKWPND
jgi:hypothetical protein